MGKKKPPAGGDPSPPKKRKPAYTVYARVEPRIGKALDAYIARTKPEPTLTSVLEFILERFLIEQGLLEEEGVDGKDEQS